MRLFHMWVLHHIQIPNVSLTPHPASHDNSSAIKIQEIPENPEKFKRDKL